jgi:uncharacterized YccA/Bax inhibitor family protein
MKTWFRSANGVLWLSFFALLSLLVRSYVDTAFILAEDYSRLGFNFTILWILGYMGIIGGWIWALVATAKGSRRSLIALLVYAIIIALGFGAASLLVFVSYPIEILIFGISLITGSIASISALLRLRATA